MGCPGGWPFLCMYLQNQARHQSSLHGLAEVNRSRIFACCFCSYSGETGYVTWILGREGKETSTGFMKK